MKPPLILKTILDIVFFFGILGLFAPFLILLFSLTENPIPIEINGRTVSDFTYLTIGLIAVNYLISIFSVYIIYLIRKLVRSFFKNKFFTKQQISLLNITGKLIIICSVAQIFINFFSTVILEGKARVGISVGVTFDNFLFVIAIGLFFIYLAKLFDNARIAKEENELTV